jgi:carbon-monoxide dehydrogenase large subunit
MADGGIGDSVLRKEDARFLTGAGNYTDDINRPNQCYAVFVRSPHAHAEIRSIDTAGATSAPGVVAAASRATARPRSPCRRSRRRGHRGDA